MLPNIMKAYSLGVEERFLKKATNNNTNRKNMIVFAIISDMINGARR